jgi:hypothetical protein
MASYVNEKKLNAFMKRQWENEELIENWMLSVWDLTQLGNKIGATRLGFAVLLKFFQHQGSFPSFKNEVAEQVISFVTAQVGVVPEAYLQYDWNGRTIKDHRAEIRELLGFRESTVIDAEQMQQWLIVEVLPQEHQEERLREQAYQWFRRLHLEAPTPDRLARLIHSAAQTFEQQLYEATLARLPEASQAALEALLSTEEQNVWQEREAGQQPHDLKDTQTSATTTLQQIRTDPGRVGLATMLGYHQYFYIHVR